MDIYNIHTRADLFYRQYVDARLWASAELDKNAPLDAKLAFSIGASGRGSDAPLLTRSEVRDEIVRLLCSEAKVDGNPNAGSWGDTVTGVDMAAETPFPNPEKAADGPYTVKLDFVPGKDVADAQVVAAMSTPIGAKIEPLNRGPWAADDAADMARIKDLLADRRSRIGLREGEAPSYADLVAGLIDELAVAVHDLTIPR